MKKQQNPYEEKVNQFNNRFSQKNKKKIIEQKKNPNKIVINVTETQYPVVRLVAKKLKWNVTSQPINNLNFDLCWIDGHCRQEIFARMQPYQKINHFPGMEILSRKNFLGKSLMEFKRKFPQQYDFFPLTWNLPTQFSDLKQFHQNRTEGKAQTFICKPEAGCQGRGIFLTRNIDKLKYEKCVVQRYMSKPFLIEGLKFDLRIYVLIAGTDPLRIFVYNEGLARFCTEKYQVPKSDNLDNKFMHLTNYAINKFSPDFIFNENAAQCDKGHKRSLTSIYKTLEQMGQNVEEIKERINDMIIKTIITGYPTLSRYQQGSHPENFGNDMCFEILGFDVILNHKLNPFILQINYTPSFTIDTPFDKLVKKNLIYDTMKLLNINQKWKRQVRKKRQSQLKERMLSGKRTKYSQQQKKQLLQKYARLRDEHQKQNLGGYTKIFCRSEQQMLKYAHYYQFAEMLYQKENKITGVTTSKSYMPFYMAYAKSPRNQSEKQFSRTGNFSSAKFINKKISTKQERKGPKSIQNRRVITSAKQQSFCGAGGVIGSFQTCKGAKNQEGKSILMGQIQKNNKNKEQMSWKIRELGDKKSKGKEENLRLFKNQEIKVLLKQNEDFVKEQSDFSQQKNDSKEEHENSNEEQSNEGQESGSQSSESIGETESENEEKKGHQTNQRNTNFRVKITNL